MFNSARLSRRYWLPSLLLVVMTALGINISAAAACACPVFDGFKTVSGTFEVGSTVTYSITLYNEMGHAQGDNPGDEFSDILPALLELSSATATSGTAVANIGTNTVTWNGSIPTSGSVTISISATILAGAEGQTVSNQGTFSFDDDNNGTNESSGVTDDPDTIAPLDPTSFDVASTVPEPPAPPLEVEVVSAPPPPATPLCEDHNFDEGGVVHSSTADALGYAVNCRVLYQNSSPTSWLGGDLYDAASIGIPGIVELGVQQAVDIFSPSGMNIFTGGAVFCLKGTGTLIWIAASGQPRHAEIIGSYEVPEWEGFTCATLFEPGTLVLVTQNPLEA